MKRLIAGLAFTAALAIAPASVAATGAPRVTEPLVCNGPAGTTCHGSLTMTTVELVRHKSLVALTNAATKRRVVVVGSSSFALPAGSSATEVVRLNALGRQLLARFRKLPVAVTVRFTAPDGSTDTTKVDRLVVKQHN